MTEKINWGWHGWVEDETFGQGSYGKKCMLCGADDYSRPLVHDPRCPAERLPTREALLTWIAERSDPSR